MTDTPTITPSEADEAMAASLCNEKDDPHLYRILSRKFARHAQQAREEEREAIARMVDKRRDDRFAEHGTTEWDTNASYYSGRAAEAYESLDEEDEAIAAAIRNRSQKDQAE